MLTPTPLKWVTVQTTLPAVLFPPLDSRPDFRTKRLVMRPMLEGDFAAWRAMRTQPEVMMWTVQGQPDQDEAQSRNKFKQQIAPEGDSMYIFAICLAETGELIGDGGCHMVKGELGWPVVGYRLKREFWGRGYATEFLDGFLDAWWALPRADTELRVEESTLEAGIVTRGSVKECIVAVTSDANQGSQNVLGKCKLELVKAWEEPDSVHAEKTALLFGFLAR